MCVRIFLCVNASVSVNVCKYACANVLVRVCVNVCDCQW